MSIASRDSLEPVTLEMRAALADAYPDAQRLLVAFRLALDVEACADLLAGRAVDPARLDQGELVTARRKRLLTLTPAIDALPQVADG